MKRHQLTVQFVRTVTRPGRYGDGLGLMLWVKPGKPGNLGRKSWVQRLTIRGRRRDLGLGSALAVSLAEARKTAFANWVIAKAGEDPTRDAAAVPTFAEALESVIEMQRGVWKNDGKSEHQWRSSMAAYALPRLGRRTVDRIDTADVMAVLLPIWSAKHETAKRVRQRIGAVMLWSVAQGHPHRQPCRRRHRIGPASQRRQNGAPAGASLSGRVRGPRSHQGRAPVAAGRPVP